MKHKGDSAVINETDIVRGIYSSFFDDAREAHDVVVSGDVDELHKLMSNVNIRDGVLYLLATDNIHNQIRVSYRLTDIVSEYEQLFRFNDNYDGVILADMLCILIAVMFIVAGNQWDIADDNGFNKHASDKKIAVAKSFIQDAYDNGCEMPLLDLFNRAFKSNVPNNLFVKSVLACGSLEGAMNLV